MWLLWGGCASNFFKAAQTSKAPNSEKLRFQNIDRDISAYATYCREQLGFVDVEIKPQSDEAKGFNEAEFSVQWDQKYKAHYDALRRCCDNPKQAGSRTEVFGN